ncbi:MAG TPA: hypothetical protein VFQ36_11025 [Ktedonobacteraceae bacterium]|nr:hypothetical protein [Ktedonobacteraceae bacterium]
MMHSCRYRNYRFISVMFWAFPYLLWQTFGHISGFFVGLLLAVILTAMFNNLSRQNNWNRNQQPVRTIESQPLHQEEYQWDAEPYQRGYRAEPEPYRAEQQPYQTGEQQTQHEEMQVEYPEMPPMEQR